MEAILILIPLSFVIMGVALWTFMRAVDQGQFDNLRQAGESILADKDEDQQLESNH